MKRKYLIICIVLIVLFVPIYFFLMQEQNGGSQLHYSLAGTPSVSAQVSQGATSQTGGGTQQAEDVQATPEQVTKALYMQFLNANDNPFANGKFKTNKYLADSFKEDIASLYNNGNKPIFCPENKKESVTVGQRTDVYNKDYGYLAQLFITENVPNGKNLYNVLVQNDNGKWVVFDVNCVR